MNNFNEFVWILFFIKKNYRNKEGYYIVLIKIIKNVESFILSRFNEKKYVIERILF